MATADDLNSSLNAVKYPVQFSSFARSGSRVSAASGCSCLLCPRVANQRCWLTRPLSISCSSSFSKFTTNHPRKPELNLSPERQVQSNGTGWERPAGELRFQITTSSRHDATVKEPCLRRPPSDLLAGLLRLVIRARRCADRARRRLSSIALLSLDLLRIGGDPGAFCMAPAVPGDCCLRLSVLFID